MLFKIKVFLIKLRLALLSKLILLIPHGKPVLFTGKDASIQLCENIHYFGHKKILIVTDQILVKLGALDKLKEALVSTGVEYAIYDQVEPNPTYKMVDEGTALFVNAKCDSLLAVGGGSPIDTAKAIALAAANPKMKSIQLAGPYRAKRRPKPLYAIPTTAGTGSEVTLAAVISHPVTHKKLPIADHRTLPVAAALDCDLMKGMPPSVTAATGMDALTHAVEAYISEIATGVTDHYARAAVRIIFANLETVYKNGENIKAREAMALASFYAGFAFSRALLGYVHAIAHQFSGFYNTPHGLANAIVLPHVLEFSKVEAGRKLATLALDIGAGTKDMSESALADSFIDSVKKLERAVNIPEKLEPLKCEDIPAIAKAAMKEAESSYPVPRYMDRVTCEKLIASLVAEK